MIPKQRQHSDPTTLGAAMQEVEVIYGDECLLVLNKPAGLLSVPGRGEDKQDCLSSRVQRRYSNALIVHRLDMATSGLMLMARDAATQRALGRLFENREVHKRYIAVVNDCLPRLQSPDDWGLIDLPIGVDWPHRPLRIIDRTHGKPSQTRWRAMEFDRITNSTRVELEPVSGRSHQLRVHLQALGHPILGDTLYAPENVQAKAPRLLLHAAALRLTHPGSDMLLSFQSAPDF